MKLSPSARFLTVLVMLTICTAAAYAQGRRKSADARKGPAARLTAMRIIPYNGMTDAFSAEVTGPDQGLFNDLDVSFLVKIEVTGKAGEYGDRDVEVIIRQGRKQVERRVSMVGIYNESGKYYVPVWIYNPICEDTVIQARILGQRDPSLVRKTITANCGE